MPPAQGHGAGLEELRDRVDALVPGGLRRHRPARVLGEHRDEGLHVAAVEGVDVALDDLAHAVVARARSVVCWLRSGRRCPSERRARPSALLAASTVVSSVSATSRRRTRARRAGCRTAALCRGQVLDGGDERDLDALAPLVAGVGRGEAVGEQRVGVGLDPDRLGQRWPLVGGVRGRPVVRRQHALRAAAR
jgi:hypothetical protein